MATSLHGWFGQPMGASSAPRTPDDRATDFTAVQGDTGEHYNGYTLMVEAYAAIWLIMMIWLALIWRKQADLGSRVGGLEAAIARAEKQSATKREREREPKTEDAEPEKRA